MSACHWFVQVWKKHVTLSLNLSDVFSNTSHLDGHSSTGQPRTSSDGGLWFTNSYFLNKEQKADVIRGFCLKNKMWESHFKQNIINSRIKLVGRRALTFYQNDFIKNEKNNTSILNNSESVLNDALISICLWKNSSSDKFNVIWSGEVIAFLKWPLNLCRLKNRQKYTRDLKFSNRIHYHCCIVHKLPLWWHMVW